MGDVSVHLSNDAAIAMGLAIWGVVGSWLYFVTINAFRYSEERKARDQRDALGVLSDSNGAQPRRRARK